MKRFAITAALAMLGIVAGAVVPAHAATPGCQAVAAGACGSWQAPVGGGVDLDVWQQHAASDTAIKVWKASATDPAEDFQLIPVAATGLTGFYTGLTDTETLASAVNIEYAPGGVPSGFCVSIVTSTERAPAALRPCDIVTAANQTFNQYQTFNKVAAVDADGTFTVFQSVLTGLVLNDQRDGGPGAQVISYPLGEAGSTPNQLWQAQG